MDTPVKQAQRRAFDDPTIANLDALIEAVKREASVSTPSEGWQPGERELLHEIIADCHALLDVDAHPDLSARIEAVLTPCDNAGRCVAPQPSAGTEEP